MLCNSAILINVTPIFYTSIHRSSISYWGYVLIALHLMHYIDQTMLMSLNKHDVRFIPCAYEKTKAVRAPQISLIINPSSKSEILFVLITKVLYTEVTKSFQWRDEYFLIKIILCWLIACEHVVETVKTECVYMPYSECQWLTPFSRWVSINYRSSFLCKCTATTASARPQNEQWADHFSKSHWSKREIIICARNLTMPAGVNGHWFKVYSCWSLGLNLNQFEFNQFITQMSFDDLWF